MTDPTFELISFEHISAIPGKALLRLSARPTFETTAATLVVNGTDRFSPLPAPPGPPGSARLAFSIPAELAGPATRYALDLGDGSSAELPNPGIRETTRVTLAGAGLAGPAPEPTAPADDGAREAIADLQRRLDAERALRVAADTAASTSSAARGATENQLRSLGAELDDARAEVADARAATDVARVDLAAAQEELRTAHGEAELGQTRATHARAEAEAAESTLLQRGVEIELLRQTLSERENHAQFSYLQWEQITAELTAEIEVARQVAADFQQHARKLQLELADSRLELTSLRALREAHEAAVADGSAMVGDSGDPAVVAAKLNAAAAALEQARSRALEAETSLSQRESELERLRGQLPT